MHLRDLLKWREEVGDLIKITDEVDWNLEAAAIAALDYCLPFMRRPIMFENIKGYPGSRLLTGIFLYPFGKTIETMARNLRVKPDCTVEEFYQEVGTRLAHHIPPTVVSTGPCKENIVMGKDVSLFAFPFPYLHEGDGGRYGSYQTYIGKDPDSDWVNYGNYRLEIHTKNKVGSFMTPGSHHADLYYQKYEARGKSMPVCIAVAPDLEVLLVSGMGIPRGISEVEAAGGLAGEPIELVSAETNDLLVPANSEIVLEGEMRPYERMDEGPFGEYHGFLHGPRVPMPMIRINCITYRNNPIIPFVAIGNPRDEYEAFTVVSGALGGARGARTAGPTIGGTHVGGLRLTGTIVRRPHAPGTVEFLYNAGGAGGRGGYGDRAAFFDEGEVGRMDDEDGVLESYFLKTHPTNFRTSKADLSVAQEMMMYLMPEDKRKGVTNRMVVDGTWPADWGPEKIPQRVRFDNSYPPKVQEWVAKNWKRWGFEEELKV